MGRSRRRAVKTRQAATDRLGRRLGGSVRRRSRRDQARQAAAVFVGVGGVRRRPEGRRRQAARQLGRGEDWL